MRRIAFLVMTGALAVSACAPKGTYSVSTTIGSTPALLTTADLRLATERLRPVGPGQDPAQAQHVFCSEPSPDVAKALSAAMEVSANLQGRAPTGTTALAGGAGFSNATAEQLAQLTSRVPSIQAMRDGLFRACEAYANGSIGDNAYSLILSRYGDVLVTLLLSENAAGLQQSSLALLNGVQLVTPPLPAAKPPAAETPTPKASEKGSGGSGNSPGAGSDATGGGGSGDGTTTSVLPVTVAETPSTSAPTKNNKPTADNVAAAISTAGNAAVPEVFSTMQKSYLQHEPVGPLMVLCSNVLDTTRPMYAPNAPLAGPCQRYFAGLFEVAVKRLSDMPFPGAPTAKGASAKR